MTYQHASTVLRWPGDLDPVAKLVLVIVADHANAGGVAWPSVDRVGMLAGISERQARRHLAGLVRRGFLIVQRPGGGRAQSTIYSINVSALTQTRTPVTGIRPP